MKQKLGLLTLAAATLLLGTATVESEPIAKNTSAQSIASLPATKFKGATIPDFQRITLGSLPGLDSSGSFKIPGQDLISFGPGDRVTDVLTLGSLKSLGAEQLNLGTISKLNGIDLGSKTLADFPLLKTQSVNGLVKAIPGLGSLPVGQVQPILDLIKGDASSFAALNKLGLDTPINQVIQQIPGLQNLQLGNLNLNAYSLLSLDGIKDAVLGKFEGALSAQLSQFLGLEKIALGDFPIPINFEGGVGTVDVVYGEKEANRKNVITGSDEGGGFKKVPCEQKNCSYIELSGIPHGKQWISGKSQQVGGGYGPLKAVNGGKEPTGILPYKKSLFKIVMTDVTESKGTADFAAYLHVCTTLPFVGETCTPYFIGPIPIPIPGFSSAKEKDTIFIGL